MTTREWLEVAFWAVLVGLLLNGERLSRKYAREYEQRERDNDDGTS